MASNLVIAKSNGGTAGTSDKDMISTEGNKGLG